VRLLFFEEHDKLMSFSINKRVLMMATLAIAGLDKATLLLHLYDAAIADMQLRLEDPCDTSIPMPLRLTMGLFIRDGIVSGTLEKAQAWVQEHSESPLCCDHVDLGAFPIKLGVMIVDDTLHCAGYEKEYGAGLADAIVGGLHARVRREAVSAPAAPAAPAAASAPAPAAAPARVAVPAPAADSDEPSFGGAFAANLFGRLGSPS
jgi:hypothetical protein